MGLRFTATGSWGNLWSVAGTDGSAFAPPSGGAVITSQETASILDEAALQGVEVRLSAPEETISWDSRDPNEQEFELPLLYLHRGREETSAATRTLEIQIAGIAPGTVIKFEAVSEHVDVATGQPHVQTMRVEIGDRYCTVEEPCQVHWTLDPQGMPSDLYHLHLQNSFGDTLWENSYPDHPDFVVLDTWDVGLGDFTVRVYYATLFPFARGESDQENRLAPEAVTDFVEKTFIPIIVETWNTQFDAWGFGDAVHPDWDDDNVFEVIVTDGRFALLNGTGTYTQFTDETGNPYPKRRIWWFSSNNSFQAYASLADGYRAVFAHEFFHTMQWNTLLSSGRPNNLWISWSEAQGRFAASAQYPELEISRDRAISGDSAFSSAANRFLAGDLNTSYHALETDRGNKYDAALYWRFLYGQFKDMGVIRASLEEMTLYYDPDDVAAMKKVLDAAFIRFDGPFQSFEESLVAFARANYALRLENGRCVETSFLECAGGYYDPKWVYVDPPLEVALHYYGALEAYRGAIPSSYGMDFVELALGRPAHGKPLRIRFEGESAVSRFSVQVWKLRSGLRAPRAITLKPETVAREPDGGQVYVIPSVDTMAYDRLALIITRLDPDETDDPIGGYTITVNPSPLGADVSGMN
jgi:hypothetical protein